MSDQNRNSAELMAELERLTAENAALKAAKQKAPGITLKVSEKKAVSIYGINSRFPVTLYKSQIDRLFSEETVAKVRQFVADHEGELAVKAAKE